jgi:hypothetical protein
MTMGVLEDAYPAARQMALVANDRTGIVSEIRAGPRVWREIMMEGLRVDVSTPSDEPFTLWGYKLVLDPFLEDGDIVIRHTTTVSMGVLDG